MQKQLEFNFDYINSSVDKNKKREIELVKTNGENKTSCYEINNIYDKDEIIIHPNQLTFNFH